jgi:hypothetical protein
MASGGKYSKEILRSLKESLADLETMKLLSHEEIQSIDRIKKQIRATIAKIESRSKRASC